MSVPDTTALEPAEALRTLPTFAFDFAVDDPDDPAEVTIYDPHAADPTTHWLSAGVAVAVDLAEAA